MTEMSYRRLGRTGIKVSVLSFGSWVSFDFQMDTDQALDCMQAAHDAGCNFFDNAEAYASGRSETIMGQALQRLGWPRWSYVLTTKLFWGLHDDVNMRNTLNRKYLTQAIDGSLERLGHDFVDVLYCHRARPGHVDRGDRVGDERHRRRRQGAVLGDQRVVGRRDPRRDRPRRAPPPAQAGHRAAGVQPALPPTGGGGVRPVVRRHRLRGHHLEPAGVGAVDGKVPRRYPRRFAWQRGRLRMVARAPERQRRRGTRSSACGRSPTSSAARSPSSPWHGAP